ncbi:MAG TPA: hypothetical protein VL984_07375 [Acidimicrobiales bacterium]|nr:hypothetical protein [Acidimicrobiales bacterium]
MTGSDIRLGRLFDRHAQRTFIIAYDHGLTSSVTLTGGPSRAALETIVSCGPDGVLLSAGLLKLHGDLFSFRGAPSPIVRTDFMLLGDNIPDYGERYRVVTTPAEAAALGADAVIMILAFGLRDAEMFCDNAGAIARAAHQAHEVGLPLIVETTLWGGRLTRQTEPELLRYACHMAVELGADAVKTEYTGDPVTMAQVVDACSVPVVILGGPHSGNLQGLVESTRAAVVSGVRGVAYGRNIWLAPDPAAAAEAVRGALTTQAR